jgi:hypothetical protein
LWLIWVVDYLLEHRWLEQAHDTSVRFQVPNDTRSIVTCTYCLSISLIDLDICNSTSVFLQWSFHNLSLLSNSPDSDFTFHASWDDSLTVVSWC